MSPASRGTIWIAAVGLAAVAAVYWAGLSGPFLFDDLHNLDALGAYGPMDHWRNLLFYLSSGGADPLGRPVSLASFLVDAQSWPADPWPFKRTNLLVHLLNTALLMTVVAQLHAARNRSDSVGADARLVGVAAGLLWGAHPFFVSTTLYVVQREAMLPMTFTLLAFLAWNRALRSAGEARAVGAWAWALVGVGGATLLAGLAKANGLLAPALVGLGYLWFQRPARTAQADVRRRADRMALICCAVPSLLILGYLVDLAWTLWSIPSLPSRGWSIGERLLSQPRALWSYVWKLALPRAGGGGIFVDDFPVSSGWLQPATTLPAVLALLASVAAAVGLRRRFPLVSFAWLAFLVAHAMESSAVPLELYFEHRNYLPAMFLGWPVASGLLQPGSYPAYRRAALLVLLAALLALTAQRASIWGDPALLSSLAAQSEVGSERAQVASAQQEVDRGDARAGLARIRAISSRSRSVDVAIAQVALECAASGTLPAAVLARTQHTLATATNWNFALYVWLQDAAVDRNLRACHGFGLAGLRSLVTAAELNPQNRTPVRKRDLWHVRGRIALAASQPLLARHWFDASLRIAPDPDYALVQAAALGDAGFPSLGAAHLDLYLRLISEGSGPPVRDMPSAHRWLLRRLGYYSSEIVALRSRLLADSAANKRPPADIGTPR